MYGNGPSADKFRHVRAVSGKNAAQQLIGASAPEDRAPSALWDATGWQSPWSESGISRRIAFVAFGAG
jgi:hypothetical protein